MFAHNEHQNNFDSKSSKETIELIQFRAKQRKTADQDFLASAVF
jgi:hypothetical protein